MIPTIFSGCWVTRCIIYCISLIAPYNSKNVPWEIVGMLRNFWHFSFTRWPVSFVCCSVYFHEKQTDGTRIFTILLTSLGLKVINFLMRNAKYLAFLSVLVILICQSNKKRCAIHFLEGPQVLKKLELLLLLSRVQHINVILICWTLLSINFITFVHSPSFSWGPPGKNDCPPLL